MERLTSQKQIILEYLQSAKTHPTAEEVFEAVKKKLPRISLGTVYRNLEAFSNKGLALRIAGEIKRYDGDTSDHHHLVCQRCKKVFDIFEKINIVNFIKKAKKFGSVTHSGIFVQGVCKNCQSEEI